MYLNFLVSLFAKKYYQKHLWKRRGFSCILFVHRRWTEPFFLYVRKMCAGYLCCFSFIEIQPMWIRTASKEHYGSFHVLLPDASVPFEPVAVRISSPVRGQQRLYSWGHLHIWLGHFLLALLNLSWMYLLACGSDAHLVVADSHLRFIDSHLVVSDYLCAVTVSPLTVLECHITMPALTWMYHSRAK